MLELLFGGAAAVALGIMVVPQAWRAWTRSTEGVATTTYQMTAAVGAVWVVYGAMERLPAVIVADSLFCVCSIAVLAACRRDGAPLRALVPVGLAVGAVSLVLALAFPPAALGWWGVTVAIALRIPQIVDAVRGSDISGVSVGTWWLGVASNVCWVFYGLLRDDPRLIAAGGSASTLSFVVVVIVEVRRRRFRTPILAET